MRLRLRLARVTSPPHDWTRRHVQYTFAAAAVALLLLASGVVLLFTSNDDLHENSRPAAPGPGPGSGSTAPGREDLIANEPMPSAPIEAAQPGQLSTEEFAPVAVPMASGLGAAGVPSGFPQTVGGAIGQLAAIDQTAIEGASVSRAQEIANAWAAPGGPTSESWSGVAAVATLLSRAGLPADAQDLIDIDVLPAMTLVKGELQNDDEDDATAASDTALGEPTFVVPCLELVLTVTTGVQRQSIAVSDCQRMVWRDGRWMIGPGTEPSPAPSLWPGSAASYDAGFRWIKVTPT